MNNSEAEKHVKLCQLLKNTPRVFITLNYLIWAPKSSV